MSDIDANAMRITDPSNPHLEEKIRVLYIDHTIYKSGAAISLGMLIRSLSSHVIPHFILRTGSEVKEIIGADDKPVYYERFMPQFMTTLRTPQYSPFLFLWHLSKIAPAFIRISDIARAWNIQILHLNETALLPYAFIGRSLGISVVIHARGATAPRPIERYFLKVIGSLSKTAVIAIDEETKESLPANCKKITQIIYNPIDLGPQFGAGDIEAMRQSWGCSSEDVVVGQVASLHTSKGIWDILDIASELCSHYDRLKFVLVGDDRAETGEGPKLREVIWQKNLQEKVVLPGYLSNIEMVYGAMDITLCLFGKHLGGVGRQAYEAALAGKPLIATLPNPERSETIKHGITGLAFRASDNHAILKSLQELIESQEKRKELGRRAKMAISERHSPIYVAQKVLSIYNSLIRS